MTTMTGTDLRALMERHREAYRRRDPVAIALCYHPDGVVVSPVSAPARGRAAIESYYAALFTAFSNPEMTVDGTVVDPPHVASFETIRATHTSDFFGYPGTNKPIEVVIARLVTAEDGLITCQRTVFDFTGLLVQVGVLRAKPGKP
jgi:uncharacterized protein (TIGR02246 family)